MSGLSGFFLVGPTAVGKSAATHRIARDHGFEVISADSMQVYKGMDIGTAKPTFSERSEIMYHGIDLVTPDKPFNVSQYRQYVVGMLRDAETAGKRMIVTGGSGLYIKSLIEGLALLPRPDPLLRKQLADLFERKGVEALEEELKRKNPALCEELPDKKNARRLIRALEIAGLGAGVKPRTWRSGGAGATVTGLLMSSADLKSRIEARVNRMYSSGLLDEAGLLIEHYPALSDTARQAIGYAEAIECLQGRCSKDEAISRTAARTRQLAKKQMTWFRRQMNVKWIEIAVDEDIGEIEGKILERWGKDGPTGIAE
jgi:tRNA dimethylallyltransferase